MVTFRDTNTVGQMENRFQVVTTTFCKKQHSRPYPLHIPLLILVPVSPYAQDRWSLQDVALSWNLSFAQRPPHSLKSCLKFRSPKVLPALSHPNAQKYLCNLVLNQSPGLKSPPRVDFCLPKDLSINTFQLPKNTYAPALQLGGVALNRPCQGTHHM